MPKKNTSIPTRSISQEILDGLQETLDLVQGTATEGNLVIMADGQPINIRQIRQELSMTHEQFAKAFHFKTKTIRNWEQGVRHPTEHTLAYLQVIAANPLGVYKTLHPQFRFRLQTRLY